MPSEIFAVALDTFEKIQLLEASYSTLCVSYQTNQAINFPRGVFHFNTSCWSDEMIQNFGKRLTFLPFSLT
jgi:hypothetical protein